MYLCTTCVYDSLFTCGILPNFFFLKTKCRYECIENDLLGSVQLGIHHNIAPYKSKGIEKASELSACWGNKVNTSDKDLPFHCGTNGKLIP